MIHRLALVLGIMFVTVLGGCIAPTSKPDKIVTIGEYGNCKLREAYSGANPGRYKFSCLSEYGSKNPHVIITCYGNDKWRVHLSTGTKWGPHKKQFPVVPKYTKEAPVEYQFDDGQKVINNWKRSNGWRFDAYSRERFDFDNFLAGMKTANKLSYSVDNDSFNLDLSEAPKGIVQFEKYCEAL